MNEWFAHYEPIWLFCGIYGEILLTLGSIMVSTLYLAKRLANRRTYQKKKQPEFESLTQGEGR